MNINQVPMSKLPENVEKPRPAAAQRPEKTTVGEIPCPPCRLNGNG